MSEAWYETEDTKLFEDSVRKVLDELKHQKKLDEALKSISVDDNELKEAVADTAIKIIIAEEHFNNEKKPLDALSRSLGLSKERINRAFEEMMEDVRAAAIEAYKSQGGNVGNA